VERGSQKWVSEFCKTIAQNNHEEINLAATTHDFVILKCEELLLKSITLLVCIFLGQECLDLVGSTNKLIAVSPDAVSRIG
jgi:hypothetical protein